MRLREIPGFYELCHMERIRMSINEKKALRNIALERDYLLSGMEEAAFSAAVAELERSGLVNAAFSEGGSVVDARLTQHGKTYLETNPKLRNPLDWARIGAVAASFMPALVAAIALFMACKR